MASTTAVGGAGADPAAAAEKAYNPKKLACYLDQAAAVHNKSPLFERTEVNDIEDADLILELAKVILLEKEKRLESLRTGPRVIWNPTHGYLTIFLLRNGKETKVGLEEYITHSVKKTEDDEIISDYHLDASMKDPNTKFVYFIEAISRDEAPALRVTVTLEEAHVLKRAFATL